MTNMIIEAQARKMVKGELEWVTLEDSFLRHNLSQPLGKLLGSGDYSPYDNKPIFTERRGAPEDFVSKLEGIDTPNHWFTAREFTTAYHSFEPCLVHVLTSNTFRSHQIIINSENVDKYRFNWKSDQVKRDTGYAGEVFNQIRMVGTKTRKPVAKHMLKLQKYCARAGSFNYIKEVVITPEERRWMFRSFYDLVWKLSVTHQDVRFLVKFY